MKPMKSEPKEGVEQGFERENWDKPTKMQRYQRMRENKARERRIELQAVVDAYNESGRWVGTTTLKRG
jgi:hypothetical protein